jgi:uncharacterized protein (DUF433 family)
MLVSINREKVETSPDLAISSRSTIANMSHGQVMHNQFSKRINLEFDMNRITLEPGKRGGRPCIRGLRITVYDVLSMLSSGMTLQEIQDDFPELTAEDIQAVLAYAADREHQVFLLRAQ